MVNQLTIGFCHGILQKGFKVPPLIGRSILKFIKQKMTVSASCLFPNKGWVIVIITSNSFQEVLGITDQEITTLLSVSFKEDRHFLH
ncbi:hypothetical protein D3C71_1900820 [compost metagenome]